MKKEKPYDAAFHTKNFTIFWQPTLRKSPGYHHVVPMFEEIFGVANRRLANWMSLEKTFEE
jgi:hypothetical protein